ncbi:hypothetical protein B0A50_04418 [Salinomyces thailandicus]|uniref:Uncharacterized protein n=1 Tax=Salinomyces thailandicus TaxID=706561 RepID=A0A4U0TZV6_9PEZI|nr:hypothetical protein B0A50_04418 [Salinomyces thailandica]
MPGRRRHLRRRKSWNTATSPISIRVGSRSSSRQFYEVSASGARDASRFARLVADQVRSFPCDPLVIAINGYQPWLEDILNSCIEDYWSAISELDRQVQFAGTMQFPERASKRGQDVPWTFVLDHMNVPQVYYWSVDMDPPGWDGSGLPDIEHYRFRVGAWECGRAACRFDREVPVAILFTKPTPVAEYVVTELLFGYLHRDGDYDQPREDEEGICWLFSRLYWLLTDWQNIISEIVTRLNEAEANSHDRHLPVKTRTRLMHNEVDRLYELKEYLHFHNRAFRKLQKLKADVPQREQRDPLWTDMDDAVEDLEQYNTTLDGLKERFNNLIELEFNIQNAVRADNSWYLSIVATIFLPISYLASLFGITTLTWPAIWYLWAAIPIVAVSLTLALCFPWGIRRLQKRLYPIETLRLTLRPQSFTMLGNELPDNVDVPGSRRPSKVGQEYISELLGRLLTYGTGDMIDKLRCGVH